MRICFIGSAGGTAEQRRRALERLGHSVEFIDQFRYLGKSRLASKWLHYTGGAGAGLYADGPLRRKVEEAACDLIWIDHGACLGAELVRSLRRPGRPIVNYMVDNPWSPIYRVKCRRYRAALPYYDLAVVTRDANVAAAEAAGARRIYLAPLCADEVAHAPAALTEAEAAAFASEVAFIGTYLPERGPFLSRLLALGVPLSIWGGRWEKAPEWPRLRPHWRGPALHHRQYALAVQASRICLGLLSKDVGDLCTSRSIEIPALGGLFCAERTPVHEMLYADGKEAVFWSDAEECAALCVDLLADEPRRAAIAARGRVRALANGRFNETVLSDILAQVDSPGAG